VKGRLRPRAGAEGGGLPVRSLGRASEDVRLLKASNLVWVNKSACERGSARTRWDS